MTDTLPTRIETLQGITDGTVTLKYVNDHKRYKYEPCEHALNGGYLEKAQLVVVDQVFRLVELTERGRLALSQS